MNKVTIQMNYAKSIAQANRLTELGNQLIQLAQNNVRTQFNLLSTAWVGNGASVYMSKADRACTNTTNTAKCILDAAAQLRTSAENIYRAEMRALEIARQRNFHSGGGGGGGSGGGGGRSW